MKEKITYIIIYTLQLFVFQANSQSVRRTIESFKTYHRSVPMEKAYLRTDKEVYAQNEAIWFSVYLVNATSHIPQTPSSLLYVDLVGPDSVVLKSLPIKIDEGIGAGQFQLADSLPEGSYTVMAYTNYMRNFRKEYYFSKPLKYYKYSRGNQIESSISSESSIDFQLFPEGGYLVNGLTNKIAFRATNTEGYGIDISGEIVDDNDNVVERFETTNMGMGVLTLKPEIGKHYTMRYHYKGKAHSLPFPQVKEEGFQLTVRQNSVKTYLTVKATPGLSLKDSYVLAHIRGHIIGVYKARVGSELIYQEIKHNQVRSGVVHFTLFKGNTPVLERLVYIENTTETPHIDVKSEKEIFQQRENANFYLSMQANDSSLLTANVSISVLKANIGSNRVDIENFLLLTSDLNGVIENPGYYSDKQNINRQADIDLLMMTHGWRRFNWQELLVHNLPTIKHLPENGFSIEGKVVEYYNRKKTKKTHLILSFLENMNFNYELDTNEDGSFRFNNLDVQDSLTALIRTVNKQPKKSEERRAERNKTGTEIRESNTFINIHNKKPEGAYRKYIESEISKERYRKQLNTQLTIEQIKAEFDSTTIFLDEVAILGKVAFKEKYNISGFVNRRYVDSIPGSTYGYANIFSLVQALFPGVQKGYDKNGLSVFKYRNKRVAFILNGQLLQEQGQIAGVIPGTVEYVVLYRGAISIRTRLRPKLEDPKGFQTMELYGYHQPEEYYTPKYNIMSKAEKLKPDFRTTQYWNPKVKLLSGFVKRIDYYTSDEAGDFVMYIEGITNNGWIVKDKFRFSVR